MIDDETKAQIMMMTNDERLEYMNNALSYKDLRFKFIELADLKQQVVALEKEIKPHKPRIVEVMKALSLGEFEISDGVIINFRKGSSHYRVSYKDIEKEFPHLLDELEPIIKITNTSDTYTTKFKAE